MEIPEHLHELVDRLGHALVQALAADPASRALAREIQGEGFEVTLLLEATVALHKREGKSESSDEEALETMDEPHFASVESTYPAETERTPPQWSEEDRAFLRTFKIALD